MSEASEATQFKFGNQAWKARSSHGRKPIFANPEELEAACDEYFKWVDENPLMGVDVAKYQGSGTLVPVPRMRAMTIVGLCNFLDITNRAWLDYKERPDFTQTCELVEKAIYQQKVEGAAAELLNPNFIGREIGLSDKQEVDHSGSLEIAGDLLYKKNADK